MKRDEELFQQHKKLIEQIRREESLQPQERNNEGFYTTKGLFLEYGLSAGIDTTLEHKLWRDRGMYEYMRRILLKLFNNLNPLTQNEHIDQTIASGAHKLGTKYPDISWEHLECHAATMKIQELRQAFAHMPEGTSQSRSLEIDQDQTDYEHLTLDELVELRHRRDTRTNKKTIRDTLTRHCRDLRDKHAKGEIEIPCSLYTNTSELEDIEIIYIPPKGTAYKFKRINLKE
jgi:hypothetical protein